MLEGIPGRGGCGGEAHARWQRHESKDVQSAASSKQARNKECFVHSSGWGLGGSWREKKKGLYRYAEAVSNRGRFSRDVVGKGEMSQPAATHELSTYSTKVREVLLLLLVGARCGVLLRGSTMCWMRLLTPVKNET